MPEVKIEGADKYVHSILHFIFVTLWCINYRKNTNLTELRLLSKALLFSVAYGGLIEVAQEYFTTTRQADVKDVAANFTGAVLAILLQLIIIGFRKRNAA